MKTLLKIILLIIPGLLESGMNAACQDANAVLEKMDKIFYSPVDKQGKVAIILTDKTGKEKIREAQMYQKGRDKKLYKYTKPESQLGVATLSLPNDVMWLYMPAFEKPKKISMLAKKQSFTGTDFSYEDMATTLYADRFTPDSLQIEQDLYVLRLIPKSDNSAYSKVIVRINKTYGYPATMEFYNAKGKKIKESTYRYEKIGEYWNAAEVVMKDLEKNHSTKILLSDIKFDQGLSDDIFTVEKLKPAGTDKKNDSIK
jgi:outer membrane lipoprotein-sorting protein